ncbi:unnamed protein product [Mytilus edulis]|uniref:Peptidase A2 domain-containing protein n=1 Tax=Mytilus edulis TaxID=6550 RepID=A0A8S3PNF5_MYTED|nr:unnamed protein product [Mytilus edulis]
MQLKLEGNALSWFQALPNMTKQSTSALFKGFSDHFLSLHPTWMLEQQLYERSLSSGEGLEEYITDIQRRCKRLLKTDRETVTAFIRGLPASVRLFVIQKNPKDFKEAIQSARLAQESLAAFPSFDTGSNNIIQQTLKEQQEAIQLLTKSIQEMKAADDGARINSARERTNSNNKCQLCSLSMHAMIDTGADISVANPSILSKLDSVGINVVVKPSDKKVIITANDEHVEIVGTINVDLKVGDESSDVKFYLVPCLTPQLILGLDFLNHQGAVIDFNAQKISFDPRRVLIAKSDITVPPKSEVVIAAKIKGAQLPENVLGLASESLSLASRGLLAANSIAHVSNGTVMHGLCNIFDKPIKIKKNSNVGKFVCISRDDKLYDIKLENTQQVGGVNNKRDIDLPDVSRDLKVEERGQLNDLLRKYSDVFVNKEGKLGQCDVIEHEIHIPDTCKPIRQRPYKLGANKKEVLENVVSDMLKDGIIEPSQGRN